MSGHSISSVGLEGPGAVLVPLQALSDVIPASGRERPWARYKAASNRLAGILRSIGRKADFSGVDWVGLSDVVARCADVLGFEVCPGGHGKRLIRAWFCRVRLCPMCMWRRALAMSYQVLRVAHELEARRSVRWLFVTLTVANCSSMDLPFTLNEVFGGLRRLSHQAWFRRYVVGWFRTMEITRNRTDGTWHPHVHVLMAVRPGYFVDGYRRHELWVQDWRRAARLLYDPSVRVQSVRDLGVGVREVAKYVTKPGLVGEGTGPVSVVDEETVRVLVSVLRGRRLFGYGGEMRAIFHELLGTGATSDVEGEGADLVHVEGSPEGCRCPVCDSPMQERVYAWMGRALGYRG